MIYRRIKELAAVVLLIVLFTACAPHKANIEGILTEYHHSSSYENPVAVVENNGKKTYLAFYDEGWSVSFDENEKPDDEIINGILKGEITGIRIFIKEAEKGEKIEIDGDTVTVWRVYQLFKIGEP